MGLLRSKRAKGLTGVQKGITSSQKSSLGLNMDSPGLKNGSKGLTMARHTHWLTGAKKALTEAHGLKKDSLGFTRVYWFLLPAQHSSLR